MYDLVFTGFRSGMLGDASDGKTMYRLYDGEDFATWSAGETLHFTVASVMISHGTGELTVELIINDDTPESVDMEVPLSTLLNVAPPELFTYLLTSAPGLQEAE